ncbi:MAG: hypothetical protein QXL85_04780 [Candidatus Bathyarchaeia archaeon]
MKSEIYDYDERLERYRRIIAGFLLSVSLSGFVNSSLTASTLLRDKSHGQGRINITYDLMKNIMWFTSV